MSEQPTQTADRETEDQAIIWFEQVYNKRNPYPIKPKTRLVEVLDIDFWISIIVSLATVGLSALRTGSAFYSAGIKMPNVTEGTAQVLGMAEAVLAVLAYELFLLSVGLIDGRKNRRLTGWMKWIAVALVMATVVLAGAWQSSLITEKLANVTEGVLKVLAFFMAGASILAILSGELLGQAWATGKAILAGQTSEYDNAVAQWKEDYQATWLQERTRYILRVRNARKKEEEKNRPAAPIQQPAAASMQKVSVLINEYFAGRGIDPLVDSISPQIVARDISRATGQEIKENTVTVHVRRLKERAGSNGGVHQ